MKQSAILLTSAVLVLFIFCSGKAGAQSRIIPDFPLLNQNSTLEDDPNDCGEWAVASILSYWNVHPAFPYTAFDRFLGQDVDPNDATNRPAIAALAVELQDVLGYIQASGNNAFGTDPFLMQEGIAAFCNDAVHGNNYDFLVYAFNDSNPLRNDYIWNKIRTEIDQGRPVLFLIAGTISARTDYSDWNTYNLWHYMPVYGYNEDLDGRKALIAASLGNWNSTIYLDVESASNTISSFPDIWTIAPLKDPSEIPVTSISAGTDGEGTEPAIFLHALVSSASVIDRVEYEVSMQGAEWTGAGQSGEPGDTYEIIFPTAGIEFADRVWFRSRAVDYFGNYSEWSFAGSYFTIRHSVPEEDQASIPTWMDQRTGKEGITIHPNPTSGRITVQAEESVQGTLLIGVFNEAGLCVYQTVKESTESSGTVVLDLSFLPAGSYMLVFRQEHSIWVDRVIRQ